MNQPAPVQRALSGQLWRFAVSGVLGLAVDTAVLYALMALGLGFAWARVLSFLAAATFTWAFNRRHTFASEQARAPSWSEWLRYLAAMALGGVVNYAVSLAAYKTSDTVQTFPVLALMLGSVVGMTLNFVSARYLLFRQPR